MEVTNKLVQIADGVSMPMVGLGTFKPKKGEEQLLHESIVYAVVEGGYRHIDTASMYKNEDIVGEALKEGFDKGIRREDMFITTKIWRTKYYDVEGALGESLSKLQLDYVDLYLVHWMITDIDLENGIIKGPPFHQVWKDM